MAAVFSSRSGEWVKFEEQDIIDSISKIQADGMAVGRFAYWRTDKKDKKCEHSKYVERILLLDTSTMQWSVIAAPFPPGESYCVADMPEHGGLCLFSSKEQCLQLWVRNSIGKWILKKEISLMNERMKKLRRDEWMKRVITASICGGHQFLQFRSSYYV
nr:unnamed protein product [Digitaria exilis]